MEETILPKAWESLLKSADLVPVIVKSIENFYDSSWSMEPNIHDWFEMVYVKKGYAVFEIEKQSAPIGPNDIIIIRPHRTHKLIVSSTEGCEFIVFSFTFENRKNPQVSEISMNDFLNFVRGSETEPFIKFKVNQKNEIITLLDRIVREKKNEDIGSEFYSYLLVLELFVLLSRALKMQWEDNISRGTKIKELIEASVKFIENSYERDISISDISKYVFLSPGYYTRAFKEHMGVTPINYLLKLRVERAKELLAYTDKKAGDIALETGFSNQQRFNAIFKKFTGLTPTQYKKAVTNNKTAVN